MNFNILEENVIKAKNGDNKAKEDIIKFFKPFIEKKKNTFFIYSYSSEDIEQELFSAILKAIGKYTGTNSFFWYGIKSMENHLYNISRKHKGIKNEYNLEFASNRQHDTDVIEEVLSTIEYNTILTTFDKLPHNHRVILREIYINNMSYSDLMDKYSIKYSTVAKRKYTAIRKLKSILTKEEMV